MTTSLSVGGNKRQQAGASPWTGSSFSERSVVGIMGACLFDGS